MNQPTQHHPVKEDEIDLKAVFSTLYTYKFMILFITLLFTILSATYAYFQPSIYKASTTIEVSLEKSSSSMDDMLSMAMTSSGGLNAHTEIELIQSRFMTNLALQHVNLTHHYYTIQHYKEQELYKRSPFQVGMLSGYGITYTIYPIDDKHYRLVVEDAKAPDGTLWSYDENLSYEEEIHTKYFHLNVVKVAQPQYEKYHFHVIHPNKVATIVQNAISVSQKGKGSNILEISYEDNVPLRAKEFVNALADAYMHQSIERKTKEAGRKLSFINQQLENIEKNLRHSALDLEKFKRNTNTVSLSSKAQTIIAQMSEYETQLSAISIQQEMLDSLHQQIKRGKNLESISIAGLEMDQSPLSLKIQELQNTIIKKNILREDYTPMYPEVRKLNKTIKQLKGIIAATIKNLRKNIQERENLMRKSVKKQQDLLNTLPANERMFGQLQRTFSVNEKIYSYLLEKQSETAIIKAATVNQNRIIDPALVPISPIKPKRKMIVVVGFILGLIVAIFLAFLHTFLDNRIKSEEDITQATRFPLFGTIPYIKTESEKLKVFVSPKSSVTESFRNLRTNLQFIGDQEGSQVIVVTSTVGGEGKTTVSVNLAGIMSMTEKKTIILNLDMRKPTLHERFALPNREGMSTLLSKHATLHGVIQHTEYENLDVITSGPIPPNPSELIENEEMQKTLEALRKIYDIIILDTPPIGLVTDAKSLMHLADSTVYVTRYAYSKKEYFKTINALQEDKIKGLGILLNALDQSKQTYGSYGGYGYYEEK